MIMFIYSIDNMVEELPLNTNAENDLVYYCKYLDDYIKLKEMGLNAFLVEDLWDSKSREDMQEEIYDFMGSWFLDSDDKDMTDVNGFSFAKAMNGTLLIYLTYLVKYAAILSALQEEAKKKKDTVVIYYKTEESLLYKIANYLNEHHCFGFKLLKSNAHDREIENRFLIYDVIFREEGFKAKFKKGIIRIIQWLFYLKRIRNKALLHLDLSNMWLDCYAADLGVISQGSRNISSACFSSGFYFRKCHIKSYNSVKESFNLLKKALKNGPIKDLKIMNINISSFFANDILYYLNIFEGKLLGYAWHAAEILEFYKPTAIVVHSALEERSKIISFLALMKNITVVTLLDGYNTTTLFPFESKDSYALSKTIFCEFSQIGREALLKKSIKPENICVVTAPVLATTLIEIQKNRSILEPDREKYDFIIFLPIYNNYSTHCKWQLPQQYLMNALDVCIDLGCKSIGIKFKNIEYEWELYKNTISYYKNKIKLSFFGGRSVDCFGLTHKVIGSISTAMSEAATLKKQYYVFEPPESGCYKTKDKWKMGLPMAINKEELRDNIVNGRCFTRNPDEATKYGILSGDDVETIKNKIIIELANVFSKAREKNIYN